MASQFYRQLTVGESPDIQGGVSVGMIRMPAVFAEEPVLARTIGFLAMPAFGTSPAGVPWVHVDHGDTCQLCFVADERTEWGEAPTAEPVPRVAAPSRDPLPNIGQVFQADGSARAFGGLDDLLRDHVV